MDGQYRFFTAEKKRQVVCVSSNMIDIALCLPCRPCISEPREKSSSWMLAHPLFCLAINRQSLTDIFVKALNAKYINARPAHKVNDMCAHIQLPCSLCLKKEKTKMVIS